MVWFYLMFQVTFVMIGLAIGSFLNVVILRVPQDRSIAYPASHCPTCHTPLRWFDNVPVLSWLLLRARCRTCHTAISPMYPLIEVLTGLLAWLMWHRFVQTALDLHLANVAAALTFFTMAALLIVAAYTDLRTHIIPDEVSIYAVPVAVALHGVLQALGFIGWLDIGVAGSVLGAAVWGGLLWTLSTLWYRATGSEGLALGDVKLMALIGAFLGPAPGPLAVLLLASLAGSVVGLLQIALRRRSTYLPFAPMLAAAAVWWVLYGEPWQAAIWPGLTRLMGQFAG